jgi:hypothetical protein
MKTAFHMGHSASLQQILEKSVALNITKFCITLYAKSVFPSELACVFLERSVN